MNLRILKNGIGFGIQGLGLFWGFFDKLICDSLCDKGICTKSDTGNCFLIFLFVAIIFIIVGYSIITLKPKKRKKKKIDWKEKFIKLKEKEKKSKKNKLKRKK